MPTDPPSYAITYEGFAGIVGVHNAYEPDVKVGRKVLRVYKINPETGELTEHGKPKVTVAQVREFVANTDNWPRGRDYSEPQFVILDFIDNGPPKPTAEEVVRTALVSFQEWETTGEYVSKKAVHALREAGYLKDEA